MDEEGQASFSPWEAPWQTTWQIERAKVADEPGGDPPNVSWLESEMILNTFFKNDIVNEFSFIFSDHQTIHWCLQV